MKWVWIVLGICGAIFLIGFIVTMTGCEPVPPSDGAPTATTERPPLEAPRAVREITPTRSGREFGAIEEPPLEMRHRWRVARRPELAESVCTWACERAGMEFYATERETTPVGWKCLCGL